jgi:DNA primase
MSKSTFVDFRAVKAEVSMQQVLERYGLMDQLRRNGDSLTGVCPIHGGDNKTAFRVSLSKNCWNCFSRCGCGGNVLDFVAKKENISLLKAANLLVEWFDLKIQPPESEEPSPRDRKPESRVQNKITSPKRELEPAPSVVETGENKPLEFTLKNLQPDHAYLSQRGLSPETIQTFGLGFCTKGIQKDRIAIPIHNATGHLVAYAGRALTDDAPEKYQFPKGFKKSLELFNFHRAIAESADRPLVIVEGFFDVMNLWQHGVRRVVALMGRYLSPAHEELIRRHTNSHSQVIVMLDEDEAGRDARELIAGRLARFVFVKVHTFDQPGMQPDQLSADEVAQLFP